MKRRKIRLLFLLLAVLLAAGCTAAPPENASPEGSTTGAQTEVPTVLDRVRDWTIVYPDRATDGEAAAMRTVYAALGSRPEKLPQSDFVGMGAAVPENNREILIGQTNRASSVRALGGLSKNRDWTVSVFEREIVIAATDDEAIAEAADWFVGTVLPGSEARYRPGFSYYYEHTYRLSSFYGLDPVSLVIGYTDEKLADAAGLLGKYLTDATGERITAVQGNGGTLRLWVDRSMEQDRYSLTADAGGIDVRGGSTVALVEAVRAIVTGSLGAEGTGMEGQSRIPATLTDLRGNGDMLELVWYDEFEGEGFDGSKWSLTDRMYGNSTIRTSTDPAVVSVKDGAAELNAVRGEKAGTYVTNRTLTTWEKMSFQYGYMEIRAKLPGKRGAWPAFWFQSAPGHRTADYMTEIDAFEVYRFGYLEATMHKWYLNPQTGAAEKHDWHNPKGFSFDSGLLETLDADYHLFGFGWTPEEMYFTVDNVIFARYDITDRGDFGYGLGNPGDQGRLTGMQGFQDPLALHFTNWLWINYPDMDRNPELCVDDTCDFPYTYRIDYVRLYQKPGEGTVYRDAK